MYGLAGPASSEEEGMSLIPLILTLHAGGTSPFAVFSEWHGDPSRA